jgi:hypothetical protein
MKFIQRIYKMLLLISIILSAGCAKDTCIHGSGPIVSQELTLDHFNGFNLRGSFNITYKKGSEQKVIASGQQNIIDQLSYTFDNGIWIVELLDGCYSDYQLTIQITSPSIDEIRNNSAGNIQLLNRVDSLATLSIFNNGTGYISSYDSIIVDNFLNIGLTSSGDIDLIGLVKNQNINLSGSGNYHAFGLLSEVCTVSLPGSGSCEINASNTLEAFISGSGNIYYTGTPLITSSITGSGNLINSN